ncbi:MAG: hypothetical protein ACK4M0_01715 [Phreatobacter sp.]
MHKALIALATTILLAGCAGSDLHNRMMEGEGVFRVGPSPSPDSDYVVSIRNAKDFGFDPDIQESRNHMALNLLRHQCPAGSIVGETAITTGHDILGRPIITYAIRVKCRS